MIHQTVKVKLIKCLEKNHDDSSPNFIKNCQFFSKALTPFHLNTLQKIP